MIGGRAEEAALRVVADHLSPPKLLAVTTIASNDPDYQYAKYENGFKNLGVTLSHLGPADIEKDADSYLDPATSGVLVTGGRQNLLVERLLASKFQGEFRDYYNNGGDIIGTSAGASFMGDIMPLGNTHAKGFGFVPHIIDQHFSQGNRMGRLVNLVREFPDRIGIGIDENTAVVYNDSHMHVMGEGQVYVLAANGASKIHEIVLNDGDVFDLSQFTTSGEIAAG